jgi:hypothetical protein
MSVLTLKVTRHGIQKNHGSLTFTPSGTGGGAVTFSPNTHPQRTFSYTLSGTALSITLSPPLLLSGNTSGHDIPYDDAIGTVTGLDSSGNFTGVVNGSLHTNSSEKEPIDSNDSWVAAASFPEGHHHHHEAKA